MNAMTNKSGWENREKRIGNKKGDASRQVEEYTLDVGDGGDGVGMKPLLWLSSPPSFFVVVAAFRCFHPSIKPVGINSVAYTNTHTHTHTQVRQRIMNIPAQDIKIFELSLMRLAL
jgi:hypothetical protein